VLSQVFRRGGRPGAPIFVLGLHPEIWATRQTIEGCWSLVKRGISAVYHSVSKKYLQTYLDEYSFRYNRRMAKQPMFISLLVQASERAL